MLRKLLAAFDDDEGVNLSGYEFAVAYISAIYGTAAWQAFSRSVSATDGRFYLTTRITADAVFDAIIQVAE